jgi:iron complex transport system permease protein
MRANPSHLWVPSPWRVAVFVALPILLLAGELAIGTVTFRLSELIAGLRGADGADQITTVLYELRMPRAFGALLGGAVLGVAGLAMQTLFRNPLADPWALGIVGGAQFGVGMVVAAGALVGVDLGQGARLLDQLGVVTGAALGATAVMALVAWASRRVSTVTLLVLGLMISYLLRGLLSVVMHFTTTAQGRMFSAWNDGSFASLTWESLAVWWPLGVAGLAALLIMAKPMNALLLGERYADTMGLSVTRTRYALLGTTLLLTAPVTAYCGPIAFVGLTAPHLARGLVQHFDHRRLLPAVAAIGASLTLAADLVVHLPWDRHFLHLNAVNGLLGAPVVIWVLLRQRDLRNMPS